MDFMIWLIAGLVVGAAIGAVTVWMLRSKDGEPSVRALKKDNERFRNEVTDHFVETARLINELTDSYKAVFDHLSHGADSLVDDKELAERMPRVSGREVRLRHLGTPDGKSPDSKSTDGKSMDDKSAPSPTKAPEVATSSGAAAPEKKDAKPDPLKPAVQPIKDDKKQDNKEDKPQPRSSD